MEQRDVKDLADALQWALERARQKREEIIYRILTNGRNK